MTGGQPAGPLRMHSRRMLSALTEAGIIRDGDYVRRVVIDIEIGQAVVLHVERYGDERLLNLVPRLEIAHEESDVSEHGDGPVTETRGGEDPDWENARPGEPLQRKPQGQGSEELTESGPADWAPEPGWGLT